MMMTALVAVINGVKNGRKRVSSGNNVTQITCRLQDFFHRRRMLGPDWREISALGHVQARLLPC
jgi:hypothetical protein